MRPRLTGPVDEINSPRSAKELRPHVLCALRNVRRPPSAEPGRSKSEGRWTALLLGGCGRGLSALPSPGRIAGSYSSFQPLSGLAPGVLRHHGAAGPSALPMIAESGTPARDRPTRSRWLETALITATGWKCLQLIAEEAAGKPGCRISGRDSSFRYSTQECE